MFLSKLLLDPANHQVRSELANRYELHRTLTTQFPHAGRDQIGLLYRIEIPDGYTYQPITLLVQSQLKPTWENFEQHGYLVENPQVKTFDLVFPAGAMYYFRLIANPSKRQKQADGKGKRVGIYQQEEQLGWLRRKSDQGGFHVMDLKFSDQGFIKGIKQEDGKTHMIQHLAVQFDGRLQITDETQFQKTFMNGIGSAKAFGLGLLSLAR